MSNFEVFPPKCEVILLGTAQREDVFNQQERRNYQKGLPLSSDLRNQVKELAQDYCFQKLGEDYASARVQFQKSLSSTT